MQLVLGLSCALAGAIGIKLIERLFGQSTPVDRTLSSSIELYAKMIRHMHSQLEAIISIRSSQPPEVSSQVSKAFDDLIQLLGSQIRSNEQHAERLIAEQRTAQAGTRQSPFSRIMSYGNGTQATSGDTGRALAATLFPDALVNSQRNRQPSRSAGRIPNGVPPMSNQDRSPEHTQVLSPAGPSFPSDHKTPRSSTVDIPSVSLLATNSRRYELKPFTAPAMYAIYKGDRIPTAAQLMPMTCHELSETCISFFVDTLPEFETVVVRLTHGDNEPIDLSARIVEAQVHSDNRYLTRCQFIGRLYL